MISMAFLRKEVLRMDDSYHTKPTVHYSTPLTDNTLLSSCRYLKKKHIAIQLLILGAIVCALLISGCTDKKSKVFRIGVICGADFFLPVIDGCKAKMTELGFVEGQNIIYDVQSFNVDPDGERRAAEKFVNEKVDLLFTTPTQPSIKAHNAIKGTDVPLVFCYAGIEDTHLVESVPNPGGNTTGLRFPGPEQICKRLELLLEFIPGTKCVWIGYDKHYPTAVPALKALRRLASSRGVTLVEVPVDTIMEIEADLARRTKAKAPGIDAIILMPDTINHSPVGWTAIRRFAAVHGIPIGGSFLYSVEQGALFGNANDLFHVGELTAPLVSKVLQGMSAGSIPVVTPEPQLIINYQVAHDLGIEIPESLQNMATQIIRYHPDS
jgi:putative tryptophan/tyrosine transport system substrate-binding protein